MDIRTKDEFIFFMQRACEDTCNDCYIELYNILLRAFISADIDFDGQVSEDEFEGMIAAANEFPKKFGFEWWAGSGKDQFKAIDENGDGRHLLRRMAQLCLHPLPEPEASCRL
eukprot:TRINITY_DN287_c0_g1_i16.p1 TRINITY_DN287_c0_g1~~TRINITY_DN287_c0_g1_i16.p1  ORF type:complete len:113 (+),score=30.78 TRINITY_DN287_c0_g1_i16:120-458(+)